MSGVAVIGGGEATIGLVPRYLRGVDAESVGARAVPDAAEPVSDPFAARDMPVLPSIPGHSMTDELRRRIAAATVPERRGLHPIWFGVMAVAVLLALGLAFPDTFIGLLPDIDAAP